MTIMSCHRKPSLTRISCCPADNAAALTATAPDPNASVYQLPGTWTDQHNRTRQLKDLKGKTQIVAMIFTHCAYACPRIVQDMKNLGSSLPKVENEPTGFVLVSFDSQRDDPAQLARFAKQEGLDDRWTLLHGSSTQIRELSMLLNVKYQDAGNGNFIHSNSIRILDGDGVIERSIELK